MGLCVSLWVHACVCVAFSLLTHVIAHGDAVTPTGTRFRIGPVESGNRFDTVATAIQALRTFTLQSEVAEELRLTSPIIADFMRVHASETLVKTNP